MNVPCHFCMAPLPPGDQGAICSTCIDQLRALPPAERMALLNGFWQVQELRQQTLGLNAASLAHREFSDDMRQLIEIAKLWRDDDGGGESLGFGRIGRG